MDKDKDKISKSNENRIMDVSSREIEKEEDEIDLLELIGIMWVHKWWIVGITCFAAVAVVLYVFLSSSMGIEVKENIKMYTATTIALVNENSAEKISFLMFEGRFNTTSLPSSSSLPISYGNLAKELINQSSFLIELEKAYNLSGIDPGKGNLSAGYDTISGLLKISYTSNDPVKAKEVSIEAYKLIQIKFESLITDYAMEEKKFLEKKLEETREEVLTLEYKINQFQNEHGLSATSDMGSAKNLSKNEFEQYMNMKLERDINKDLIDYLPRYLLLASLKDEMDSPIFKLTGEPELSSETDTGISGTDTGISGKVLITVVIIAAFLLAIMLVFILNAVKNIRNDPERMKKLKGIK